MLQVSVDFGDEVDELHDFLKTLKPDTPPPTAALSMAGSRFETRVEAILDADQRRLPPRRFLTAPAGLAFAGLLAVLGGLQFTSSVEACGGQESATVASKSSCQQTVAARVTAEKRATEEYRRQGQADKLDAKATKRAEKLYKKALVGDKKENTWRSKGYKARKEAKDPKEPAYRVFRQMGSDSSSHYAEGMRLHTAGEYNAAIEAETQRNKPAPVQPPAAGIRKEQQHGHFRDL